MSSPTLSTGFVGALPYLTALVTAVLGFCAARYTSLAQLQKTLLDASRLWVVQSQSQHAQDAVRILKLEAEVIRQRGVINELIQQNQSLLSFMKRSGLEPPKRLHLGIEDDQGTS